MNIKGMSEKQFKVYQLEKLNKLFNRANVELHKLNRQTYDELIEFHNENSSLPYCIRWGLQATEELLEELNKKEVD